MDEDDSLNALSQTASSSGTPSRIVLNKEYLKRGQNKKGYIYGLGSVQYRDINPSQKVATTMSHNLDNEMRMNGLEKNNHALKKHNEALKEDMVVLKTGWVGSPARRDGSLAGTAARRDGSFALVAGRDGSPAPDALIHFKY
ncbi:hypothetical protein AT4G03728 [Arabidopsis thaliana]|uniref:Uncharacterized protein n=1 Tax=Arabidopsis thaliana TaxID=3702 RepID=F4JGB0_ARATH|nr:uncharacterized protein AT4G03728 [Arabidopsis thaliana]AEE82350.1 hypothetical protein AT4G03728 [Arabidopsis thaliana]|eukprot:NP_001154205.1 hypothetical protein AT4G03728 [Arabidopsis thaliana]